MFIHFIDRDGYAELYNAPACGDKKMTKDDCKVAVQLLGYDTNVIEDNMPSAAEGCIVIDSDHDGSFEKTVFNGIKGTPSKPNYKLICFKGNYILLTFNLGRSFYNF